MHKNIKIYIAFFGNLFFTIMSTAQTGKYDFTPDLGDEDYVSSGSGNGIYLFGVIYILLIVFGKKELRKVLLSVALALFGFIAYAYALHAIGTALQVYMLGDTPKNREGLGIGFITFVVGYFSPLYFYSKRKLDGTSNKENNIIIGIIFTTVFVSFVCSYVYLLSKH
jgi:hypothetical protein